MGLFYTSPYREKYFLPVVIFFISSIYIVFALPQSHIPTPIFSDAENIGFNSVFIVYENYSPEFVWDNVGLAPTNVGTLHQKGSNSRSESSHSDGRRSQMHCGVVFPMRVVLVYPLSERVSISLLVFK